MYNPNHGEKMTSLNISAVWTKVLKRVLILSIRMLTKVLNKMKEPEWWEVSQEMEADELSLIPPHEYPHVNRKKVHNTVNMHMASHGMQDNLPDRFIKSFLIFLTFLHFQIFSLFLPILASFCVH